MTALKLSYEDFLLSLKLAPRIVVELVIENNNHEILLIRREQEPFVGSWHLPGGFIMKGETIAHCIKRISLNELKVALNPKEGELVGIFENIKGDPRGHLLHCVFNFHTQLVDEGKYFSKLPSKLISYQRDFLTKIHH